MSFHYRNSNTSAVLTFDEQQSYLDALDNWTLIDAPEFDPSGHTVDEVNAYLATADIDERHRVLQAEIEARSRVGILDGPHSDLPGL